MIRILMFCLALAFGASSAPAATQEAPGAYLVVMGTVTDREKFAAYLAALPPIYARYGGHYVMLQRNPKVVEGAYPHTSLVVSAFASVAAAEAFWNSPEYRAAVQLREGAGRFDVLIVPAFVPPAP